jgi:hypothetical protein
MNCLNLDLLINYTELIVFIFTALYFSKLEREIRDLKFKFLLFRLDKIKEYILKCSINKKNS